MAPAGKEVLNVAFSSESDLFVVDDGGADVTQDLYLSLVGAPGHSEPCSSCTPREYLAPHCEPLLVGADVARVELKLCTQEAEHLATVIAMRTRSTTVSIGVAGVAAADSELADTLDNLDGAGNYAGWILAQAEPHLGMRVLEVGAGHGTFTAMLSARGHHVVATDISERCVGILRKRFAADERVTVVTGGTEAITGMPPSDAAVLINVLEHIPDDDAALRELGAALKPGGRLILWVPAFQALYSDFDRKVGHYRRYTKNGLRDQLIRAGYEVPVIRYHNMVGALAWLLAARLLHRNPTGGSPVKIYDSVFVPVLKRLEGTWGAPFGQSVFAVATWPGNR